MRGSRDRRESCVKMSARCGRCKRKQMILILLQLYDPFVMFCSVAMPCHATQGALQDTVLYFCTVVALCSSSPLLAWRPHDSVKTLCHALSQHISCSPYLLSCLFAARCLRLLECQTKDCHLRAIANIRQQAPRLS